MNKISVRSKSQSLAIIQFYLQNEIILILNISTTQLLENNEKIRRKKTEAAGDSAQKIFSHRKCFSNKLTLGGISQDQSSRDKAP